MFSGKLWVIVFVSMMLLILLVEVLVIVLMIIWILVMGDRRFRSFRKVDWEGDRFGCVVLIDLF